MITTLECTPVHPGTLEAVADARGTLLLLPGVHTADRDISIDAHVCLTPGAVIKPAPGATVTL